MTLRAAILTGLIAVSLGLVGCEAESSEPAAEAAGDEAADTTGSAGSSEGSTTEPSSPSQGGPRMFKVARVIDGDTIALGNGDRVRLVQIDAPEAGGECYAAKSTDVLRNLLPSGARIRLARDPGLDDRDQYDRLLRYVFKGGKNVNLVLVQRGAASVWFYQGERGRFAAKLKRAADTARAKKRGAWGACKASTDYEAAWTTEPKPKPKPKPAQPQPANNCHPSYTGACLDPSVSDYDCAGGSGNGPAYTGQVRVVGYDEYGLDGDGDGIGCE